MGDYFIIDIDKETERISKEIIENLHNGQPHDEALASIETKVEEITDEIKDKLSDEILEYLNNTDD